MEIDRNLIKIGQRWVSSKFAYDRIVQITKAGSYTPKMSNVITG